ncbi:ras-related and estrogen-regulated growth inhibitor-like [Dreissena polymorpha]|uniref:small monomeric GTPase n=1 Tax=Dreissena polymorpha TaxID=45954 RepID=A0A9D4CMM2_DREPO|nr:ras-related and estrogen-regulated growth inhibitor-like [Dreissena polymorpha]KAH3728175.1 hypothetical protein DPMN_054122 [Dreissena polymorpha]
MAINGVRGPPGIHPGRLTVPGQKPRASVYDKEYNCCRIVLLGIPGVGKTALTVRFMTRRFIGEYCPTLETIHRCQCHVDNEDTRTEILDTAGQMCADGGWVWKDYYAFWGDCYLFIYSINDRQSFEQIMNFKRHVENIRQAPVFGLLVGNKADLLHDRQVPEVEGIELADEIGCRFYEISAADWTQVDKIVDLFHDAVREYRRSRGMRMRRPSSSTRFRQAIQKVITGKGGTTRRSPSTTT